ncbi:MAG: endonuclease/exonuclease/phosphatase family protein [Patescibacteria group bacterium]
MKIISLNTWGGRAGKEGLLSFFKEHKNDTDIFCLQEIWSAPYNHLEGYKAGGKEINHSEIMDHGLQEITLLLSDFTPYFRPHHGDHYGLLMLVKKNIEVKVEGEIFVHKHKGYIPEGDVGNHARNIQFITTEFNDTSLTVINFHGLWSGGGKGDSEDRLNQSNKIKEFIETLQGNVVMCGDFNLLPNTQSIQILEDTGLRNLIKETGVTSTRTSYYTKPEKFADYIFVSREIEVKEFKVLPDEVSDHAPLLLKIETKKE